MISKLPELDQLSLMAGVVNPSIEENRNKINEIIDLLNKKEEIIPLNESNGEVIITHA